jgi:ethanolamine utilization protein EutP
MAVSYHSRAIDTPGEMIAIPRLFNALILNSSRVRLVLFVMDGERPRALPAKLALALKAPSAGAISKCDLSDPASLRRAEASLRLAGAEPIFKVSAVTGEGLEQLKRFIEDFLAA